VCQPPVIDVNKVDVRVETVGAWNGRQRSISLQLKATSKVGTATVGGIDYVTMSLDREYYDDMRVASTVPLFLVVVALPPLTTTWTRVRQGIHALNSATWWGVPSDPPNGKKTQIIRIPASQRLDLAGLQTMLASA
jgi:hypothetical protein